MRTIYIIEVFERSDDLSKLGQRLGSRAFFSIHKATAWECALHKRQPDKLTTLISQMLLDETM